MATKAQKAKAAERRESMQKLADEIAALSDAQRADVIGRFGAVVTIAGNALSAGNAMMLMMQTETLSVVGGFRQWLEAGRVVRKGEKGLAIWTPRKSKPKDEEEEEKLYFSLATVFDISQTDKLEEKEAEAA